MSGTGCAIVRPALIWFAATIIGLLAGCAPHPGTVTAASTSQVSEADQSAPHSDADIKFVRDVVAINAQIQQIATLTGKQSHNTAMIGFAKQDAAALQSDVQVLKVLSLQWTEGTHLPAEDDSQVSVNGLADQARVTALGTMTDREFDTQWAQIMTDLNSGLLAAAESELSNGANGDAKSVAQKMKVSRRAAIDEINQMRIESGNG